MENNIGKANKISNYIYIEANKHADNIIKNTPILNQIKEALVESYIKGFMKASILASNYQNKTKEKDGTN